MTQTATRALTRRQTQVLDFIRDYSAANSRPPTLRLIGEKLGIASPNGVMCHLRSLERKGLITRDANAACGIRLTGPSRDEQWAEICQRLLTHMMCVSCRESYECEFDETGKCIHDCDCHEAVAIAQREIDRAKGGSR